MQLPIPNGTVLQNRYCLIGILGQGGFGRTYLAEDKGRFNERCALKELIPPQVGREPLAKAKELFQREAATLYQIEHPQIPRFRATFEQDGRLFLVQDYVEGQTYRQLLDERQLQGRAFNESEVLQALLQILPVLAYLHNRGIVHRDIAPDNIILRSHDRLPVLIDFGVVKELVTRIRTAEGTVAQSTAVGKPGYAPIEQIQTGQAYPNSDLYALAVTALVLLTGRSPQELYDPVEATWSWTRWINLSAGFAQVLERMLSYRPGDRYQSAPEVARLLQSLPQSVVSPPIASPSAPSPQPDLSQMRTMAVGRSPDPVSSSRTPAGYSGPQIPSSNTKSSGGGVMLWVIVGTVVALCGALGAWLSIDLIARLPKPTPTPTPTSGSPEPPKPTASPTSSPRPSPSNFRQVLNLIPGKMTSVNGNLRAGETANYTFTGEKGQELNAAILDEGVVLTVLTPNQIPASAQAKRVRRWRGDLTLSGNYTLQLSPVRGVAQSDYQLDIELSTPAQPPSPTPTSTPSESPSPTPTSTPSESPSITPKPSPSPSPPATIDETRVNIPVGETAVQVSGQADSAQIKRYLVNAREGQVLSVNLEDGAVGLDIRYPNGELVEGASRIIKWKKLLSQGGDYQIDAIAEGKADFRIEISITDPE